MNPYAPRTIDGETLVGQGDFTYRAVLDWPQLPEGWSFGEAVAMATDSTGRVYIFNRGEHPTIVFDADGKFLTSWGEGDFVRPHGLVIDANDVIFCADDFDHTVHKCKLDGERLLTLGVSGQATDTGATTTDYRDIIRAGPPFNIPTNVAFGANGELFITDGYGNARVHVFSSEGELLRSWGEPGSGPGQFHLPHGIAITADGTVVVADRENSRLQFFSPDGEFLNEWTEIARPCQVHIDGAGFFYVAEVGYKAGMYSGVEPPEPNATGGRVSIFAPDGELQSRWGGGDDPCAPGDFFAPHDVWVDAEGSVYVSEVTLSAGGNRGLVSPDCHTVQKFERC
jgi:DNA-binding beta-propeller fold protein YncE